MKTLHRIILFIVGCVGVRSLFVYISKTYTQYLPVMGLLALLISIGFFNSFLKYKDGDVGAFGGNVWWNNLRLLHSIIYLLFAISAMLRIKWSWIFLLADILIGILAFTYHYTKSNLSANTL